MADKKEATQAVTVEELFKKSKIGLSDDYIKNFQKSYDDGDLSIEELEDLIDSVKTVEKGVFFICRCVGRVFVPVSIVDSKRIRCNAS